MNPFDLKSVLLARHAQHVVLIHFPIALFLVSVAFDFAAQWRRTAALAAVAYYNLTVAAILVRAGSGYRLNGVALAARRPKT